MSDFHSGIRLVSVSEIEGATAINRRDIRRLGRNDVHVDMNVRLIVDRDKSLISMVVSCSYLAVIGFIRRRLLVCSAVATFEIETHDAPFDEGDISSNMLTTMLGVAVGALRGIVAVRISGTPLQSHPLPMVDLAALMARLAQ